MEPSIVLRIPNECVKLFRCDQYLRQPKMNPWADREYLSSIYAAFPWLTTRGTYRLRDLLTHKLKVVVYEKGTCLAKEDCLMAGENLVTVVSGLLNFYKRPVGGNLKVSPFTSKRVSVDLSALKAYQSSVNRPL